MKFPIRGPRWSPSERLGVLTEVERDIATMMDELNDAVAGLKNDLLKGSLDRA